MKINQISLKNFRSIGDQEISDLSDLKRFNLFIGENNSGKSNIIRIIPFLSDVVRQLPALTGSFSASVNNSHSQIEDFFHRDKKQIELSVTFAIDDEEKKEFVSGISTDSNRSSLFQAKLFNNQGNTVTVSFIISLGENGALNYQLRELVWVDFPLISVKDQIMRGNNDESIPSSFSENYGQFSSNIANFNYLNVILKKIADFHTRLRVIKAVRKIGGSSQQDDGNTISRIVGQLDIDGARVIDDISTWRSPNNAFKVHYEKYEILNLFVSKLLDLDLTLLVSEDNKHLLIKPTDENKGDIMSYKSWGSSVEELVVLMVDILSSPENSIIALEEPEIHLDPFMQRKLISFLKEQTNHQYFVTSHSNILINSFTDDISSIFRIYKMDGMTKALRANQEVLHHVLDDLGIKASDLLQTNGVVWVEGPSDRIFINKWISLIDSELKEGVDYTIMFYGGRLLSHLSADITEAEREAETNDFIKLLQLNRNMVVVIDSDRKKADDEINKTKQRIEREIGKNSDRALVWITDGREIENYIPPQMFIDICEITGMSQFTKITELDEKYNKVNAAKKLVDQMTPQIFEENTQLKTKILQLVERIKLWNKEKQLS